MLFSPNRSGLPYGSRLGSDGRPKNQPSKKVHKTRTNPRKFNEFLWPWCTLRDSTPGLRVRSLSGSFSKRFPFRSEQFSRDFKRLLCCSLRCFHREISCSGADYGSSPKSAAQKLHRYKQRKRPLCVLDCAFSMWSSDGFRMGFTLCGILLFLAGQRRAHLFFYHPPERGATDAQALGGGGLIPAGLLQHPQGHVLIDLLHGPPQV